MEGRQVELNFGWTVCYCPIAKRLRHWSLTPVFDGSNPSGAVREVYMNNTYNLFTGDELVIAEKIQQRRYQLLIHSCIYYHLNQNIISDKQWDEWARELRDLQNQYPNISKQITLYEYFKDWDASTGAFLPITNDWVIMLSKKVLKFNSKVTDVTVNKRKEKETKKRRLF